MKTIVIFVDNKSRDLMGDALITHHLQKRGYRCVLESLEAWRACLGAWKPDFILFNHLGAAHLADYSQQLKKQGVLTGILLNEGIFHVPGDLEYSSKKQYDHAHCDLMLCWNKPHHDALVVNSFCESAEQVVALGVPRFDFYCAPWKELYENKGHFRTDRKKILANANFPMAHFQEAPREEMDRFFSQWTHINETFANYEQIVADSHWGQQHFLNYLNTLIAEDRYEILVRPHPREDPNFYLRWYEALDDKQREHVSLVPEANITELILACDVEISCENCTTTLEAWIAGKPTVGLTFKKNPFFYLPANGALLPECNDPDKIVEAVEEALARPEQPEFATGRKAYMTKWIFKNDGQSAERAAEAIIDSIENRPTPKAIKLSFPDLRRALKLRLRFAFNEPYPSRLKYFVKYKFTRERGKHTRRYRDYLKAIRPSDTREALAMIANIDPNTR